MNATTYVVSLVFFALAFAPVGALLAAGLAREFVHVVIMLYWIGGFATASHMVVIFGS